MHSAREAIRGLNRGSSSSRHVLLQDYLTLRVAFKAVAQYVRIRKITKQLATRIPWTDSQSGLDVSPLVCSRLNTDFQGIGAARNALWLSLFDEALLRARMARGAVPKIGVAHVPVRTWDLRYAIGFSGVSAKNGQTLPDPSHVVVTDPQSEATMTANGRGASAIIKTEALRFLRHSSIIKASSDKRTDAFPSQRVLVFGEYDPLMCAKQLQILRELAPLVGDKCAFTFRLHPAKQILQECLPTGVSLSEVHTAGKALADCAVVLCSNVSSASLAASLRGIPILMLKDGRRFNGSALIPGPSATHVDDAADVIGALGKIELGAGPRSVEQFYPMYLDDSLTRWRALVDSLANIENK